LFARYSQGTAAIVLSLVVVCILLFTGWKGWEMVYRHRVGVAEAEARRSLEALAQLKYPRGPIGT
jgi:hypothetical protein